MRRERLPSLLLTAAVCTLAAPLLAQQGSARPEYDLGGENTYKTYCSACHGAEARGDGPIADSLRYRPQDLTTIARRANGTFDRAKVHRMIDGRDPVKGHGGPDMPLWGDAFRRSGDGYDEKAVSRRIDAIVEYLETLQQR